MRFLSTALLHPETRTQALTCWLTSPSELSFDFELDRKTLARLSNGHCSSLLPVTSHCLAAKSKATSQSIATDFVSDLYPMLEVEGGEAGGAAEQLRPGSLEKSRSAEVSPNWAENLMRSGVLGLPASGLSSVLNINELSVF